MHDTVIRNATPGDAEKLLDLIDIASAGLASALFAKMAPDGVSVKDYTLSQMDDPEALLSYTKLWVCEIEGAVAGFIAIDQTPEIAAPIDPDAPELFRPLTELENEAPGCCLINLVATFPEYRGRGAGRALMQFAETRRGKNGLCLTVGDTNLGAQKLYHRLGYRIVARRPVIKDGWESSYSDWLLMVKN